MRDKKKRHRPLFFLSRLTRLNSPRQSLPSLLRHHLHEVFSSSFDVARPNICRLGPPDLLLFRGLFVRTKGEDCQTVGQKTHRFAHPKDEAGGRPPLSREGPPALPGRGRLPRSSASLTTMRKPMNSCPFISAMAFSPPSLVSISTKPKHLLCPVSRSVTTLALRTPPMAPNHSNKSDSTASRLSLATKSFIRCFYKNGRKLREKKKSTAVLKSINHWQSLPNAAKICRMSFTLVARRRSGLHRSWTCNQVGKQFQDVGHGDLAIVVQVLRAVRGKHSCRHPPRHWGRSCRLQDRCRACAVVATTHPAHRAPSKSHPWLLPHRSCMLCVRAPSS